MGWLIALGAVTLLAVLPLGVTARYDAAGAVAHLIIGPVRLQVFPGKKKNKKPKEKTSTKERKASAAGQAQKTEQKNEGGSFADFLPLVHTALDLLGDLRRKLRVNYLQLRLIMAGGDPCDLAVGYGKAWAAVGNLMPLLENVFVIKKRDVEVACDFVADQTTVTARLDLTLTLGRLLYLAVRYGVRAVIQFMKIINQRKGGAKT